MLEVKIMYEYPSVSVVIQNQNGEFEKTEIKRFWAKLQISLVLISKF